MDCIEIKGIIECKLPGLVIITLLFKGTFLVPKSRLKVSKWLELDR